MAWVTPLQVLVLTKRESQMSGREKSCSRSVLTDFIRNALALNLGGRCAVPQRYPRELDNLREWKACKRRGAWQSSGRLGDSLYKHGGEVMGCFSIEYIFVGSGDGTVGD